MAARVPAGQPAGTPTGTLAEKVEWLVSHAHPAGRGPYSNAEITALIEKATGQQFSHTTIWKLRNGQAAGSAPAARRRSAAPTLAGRGRGGSPRRCRCSRDPA